MPYADPEQAKDYQRTYRRIRRAEDDCTTPGPTPLPVEFRLQTASDVLAILGEQADAVLNDKELGTVERDRQALVAHAEHLAVLRGGATGSALNNQPNG